MQRFLAVLPLLFTVASTAAPKDELGNRLIGAWRLVAIEGTSPIFEFVVDRPRGIIMYDRSGRMSVQMANVGERKPFAKGASRGTTEEKAAAFDSYAAYYGTYTVDAKRGMITHHIEDGVNPGLRGRENVRRLEFQGDDRIVLIPIEDGRGGVIVRKDATYKLIWERIK